VYSTVEDLAHWLTLLSNGETVFARYADDAFTPAVLTHGGATRWPTEPDEDNLDPGGPVSYGFGWFLDPAFGHSRRWHFGTTEGFRTAINWFPDEQVVSVVLCNRMDLDAKLLSLANAAPFLTP
jgi:CubicO group peptidase (beta-lactamase class C family)